MSAYQEGVSESVAKLVLIVTFGAVALVGYTVLIVPSRMEEARSAVAQRGYVVQELHEAPFGFCGKNRTAYLWRSRRARGKVCVGGFLGPSVSVWQ